METKQEQNELGQLLWDIIGRECIDKYREDDDGNIVSVSSISVDGIAEEIIKAGYNKNSRQKTLNDLLEWLDGNTVRNPKQAVIEYMKTIGEKSDIRT